MIALRLVRPRAAIFLTAAKANLPPNWHEAMRRDELQPIGLDREQFTLTQPMKAAEYLRSAAVKCVVHGSDREHNPSDVPAVLSFWAGRAGFYGVGEELKVVTLDGELKAEQVEASNRQWWEYWREYWKDRGGPNPKPKDYACEATIPAKPG